MPAPQHGRGVCALQECSLLLCCDHQSQGQLPRRGLSLSVPPSPIFFHLTYLFSLFFFGVGGWGFTVSLNDNSDLPAGSFMTCCLTCLPFVRLSLQGSCHTSPLSRFQTNRFCSWALGRCSTCFCTPVSASAHRPWPICLEAALQWVPH